MKTKNIFQYYSPILSLLFCLCFNLGFSQKTEYFDGPYVEYVGDSVEVVWISEGALHKDVVHQSANYQFSHDYLPSFVLKELVVDEDDEVEIEGVQKMAIISDIHGQFDVFENLMIEHGVSDRKGRWKYDEGHLVVVGDVLDRGPEMIKVLWYLFHLEKKAKEAGGKVHILLGNHEMMVMGGNIGYVHKKYRYTSGISGKQYHKFFGENTFFGKWLSSKNVIKSINDILFLHGGLSEDMLAANPRYLDYNGIFREQILHKRMDDLANDEKLNLLTFSNGPLWYRGMAQPNNFDTKKAEKILKRLDKKVIVIGHTSMPKVVGLYDNRIILVDSNIKFGKSGELLIYKDGSFFRGNMEGEEQPLVAENRIENPESIVEQLYDQNGPALFVKMKKNTSKLTKIEGKVIFSTYFDNYGLDFSAEISISESKDGRQCKELIIKANIPSEELKSFGFSENGSIKILMACPNEDNTEWVSQRIGEMAKTKENELYKSVRLLIENPNERIIDSKAILVLNQSMQQ